MQIETIYILFLLAIFIFLEVFWIFQLIHSIKHSQSIWIAVVFFLNFIGAIYYWRLKKKNKVDSESFHKIVDTWLDKKGYSIEKSREVLIKLDFLWLSIYLLLFSH